MSRKVCIGYVSDLAGKVTNAAGCMIVDTRYSHTIPVYIDAPPRKRKLGKKEADEWCDANCVEVTRMYRDTQFGRWVAKRDNGWNEASHRAYGKTRLGAIIALRKLMRGKK